MSLLILNQHDGFTHVQVEGGIEVRDSESVRGMFDLHGNFVLDGVPGSIGIEDRKFIYRNNHTTKVTYTDITVAGVPSFVDLMPIIVRDFCGTDAR